MEIEKQTEMRNENTDVLIQLIRQQSSYLIRVYSLVGVSYYQIDDLSPALSAYYETIGRYYELGYR